MTSPHTRALLRVKVAARFLPHTHTRTHTRIGIAESFQDTFCNFNAGNQNYIHFLNTCMYDCTSPFSFGRFSFAYLFFSISTAIYICVERVHRNGTGYTLWRLDIGVFVQARNSSSRPFAECSYLTFETFMPHDFRCFNAAHEIWIQSTRGQRRVRLFGTVSYLPFSF